MHWGEDTLYDYLLVSGSEQFCEGLSGSVLFSPRCHVKSADTAHSACVVKLQLYILNHVLMVFLAAGTKEVHPRHEDGVPWAEEATGPGGEVLLSSWRVCAQTAHAQPVTLLFHITTCWVLH